jgi:hypothetical protein
VSTVAETAASTPSPTGTPVIEHTPESRYAGQYGVRDQLLRSWPPSCRSRRSAA